MAQNPIVDNRVREFSGPIYLGYAEKSPDPLTPELDTKFTIEPLIAGRDEQNPSFGQVIFVGGTGELTDVTWDVNAETVLFDLQNLADPALPPSPIKADEQLLIWGIGKSTGRYIVELTASVGVTTSQTTFLFHF